MKHLYTFFVVALVAFSQGMRADNIMSVDPITLEPGSQVDLVINLELTTSNITLYQFDLYLPDGVTWAYDEDEEDQMYDLSNRHKKDHVLAFNQLSDVSGHWRLICSSNTLKVIKTGSGALLTLTLNVASTVTTSLEGRITSILLASNDDPSVGYYPADVTFTLTLPGAVEQPAGKYVRVKSNSTGAYLGTTATGTLPMASAADAAGIYYVTPTGQMLSYQQGLFLSDAEGLPLCDVGQEGSEFTFAASAVTSGATDGTYSIATANGYLQATATGLAYSADGDDAACEFVIEEVTELPFTINAIASYATLCLPTPFSVPSSVTVMTPTTLHDGLLSIEDAGITAVDANTPVMLYKGGGGNVTLSVATEGDTPAENLLTATGLCGVDIPATDAAYILAVNAQSDGAAFRLLSPTDRAVHGLKAYYVNTGGYAPRYLSLDSNDVLTGIDSLPCDTFVAAPTYDLQGRRVTPQQGGIYVVGGRKVAF